MIAVGIVMMLVGFALGIAFDGRTAAAIRLSLARREVPQGSLRHSQDHRCSPPFSHWSSFDDEACFVDSDVYGKKIQPSDVWVCPCLRTWVARDGMWQPEPSDLKDGAT